MGRAKTDLSNLLEGVTDKDDFNYCYIHHFSEMLHWYEDLFSYLLATYAKESTISLTAALLQRDYQSTLAFSDFISKTSAADVLIKKMTGSTYLYR